MANAVARAAISAAIEATKRRQLPAHVETYAAQRTRAAIEMIQHAAAVGNLDEVIERIAMQIEDDMLYTARLAIGVHRA